MSSCSANSLIKIAPNWPQDQVAFLVLTDSNGTVIGPSPLPIEDDFARFELETNDTIKLHVVTFATRSEGGPDFETCGIAIRGRGPRLRNPTHYFVSESIDARDDSAIALIETAAADANALELTHASDTCVPSYPCDRVVVQSYEPPILNRHAIDAIVIDDHRAYASLTGGAGEPSRVLAFEDDRVTMLLEDRRFGSISAMSFDGTRFWATTEDAAVFSFDFDGTVTSTFTRGESGAMLRVATDPLGTVVVYGDFGLEVLSGSNGTQRTAIESLSNKVVLLALSSPNRIVALANIALNYFDGAQWTVERDLAPEVFEEYFDVDVGDSLAVFAGKDEKIAVRDENARMWKFIPQINGESLSLKGIAGMGNDRYIAVGQAGLAAIYANGLWCTIQTNTTNTLEGVALAPSRRVAYAVGRYSVMTGGKAALLRFELPE